VQDVVINLFRKSRFVVKEVPMRVLDEVCLLAVRHRDIRMLLEKIMERAGTSFLSASNDEIQFLDLFSFALKYHLSICLPVTQGTCERY
jgi:hypothetical protein